MTCDECGAEMSFEESTLLWMCPECGNYCYDDGDEEDEDDEMSYDNIYQKPDLDMY